MRPLERRGSATRRRRAWRGRLRLAVGLLLAPAIAEAGLRAIDSHHPNPRGAEWSSLAVDGPDAPVITVRYSREGMATAHFSRSRARLTGHPFERGAPTGLILGDSYVEATSVPDTATMGAVVEQLARATGRRLNVRQYGISGASPADFVAFADTLNRRWQPAWVVMVMNDQDLDASTAARLPHLEEGPGGWRLVPDTHRYGASRASRWAGAIERNSRFGTRLLERALRLGALATVQRGAPPADPRAAPHDARAAARLAVDALEDSYGSALVVVYVGGVGSLRAEHGPRHEDALREACARAGVRFVSTTPVLAEELERRQHLTRGFANTRPGEGHLNATGHRVVATAIAREVGLIQ